MTTELLTLNQRYLLASVLDEGAKRGIRSRRLYDALTMLANRFAELNPEQVRELANDPGWRAPEALFMFVRLCLAEPEEKQRLVEAQTNVQRELARLGLVGIRNPETGAETFVSLHEEN